MMLTTRRSPERQDVHSKHSFKSHPNLRHPKVCLMASTRLRCAPKSDMAVWNGYRYFTLPAHAKERPWSRGQDWSSLPMPAAPVMGILTAETGEPTGGAFPHRCLGKALTSNGAIQHNCTLAISLISTACPFIGLDKKPEQNSQASCSSQFMLTQVVCNSTRCRKQCQIAH